MTEFNQYVEQLLKDAQQQYQLWLHATTAEELGREEDLQRNEDSAIEGPELETSYRTTVSSH